MSKPRPLTRLVTSISVSGLFLGVTVTAFATSAEVDSVFPQARALYVDLHQHPELSDAEVNTAARLAADLRALGFTVNENIGGHGIVAIMRNGPGKTVMFRTELDALPVEEKTGLPYASKVRTKDASGAEVAVGHMCGHDLHMAALVGSAAILAKSRASWHGTLMLVGQPAEETISGAAAMLRDGIFTKFGKPDVALAEHVMNDEPAGKVALRSGNALTSSDAFRVTLFGKGGHGSMPHTTIDPVLMAARTVEALEMAPGREVKAGEIAILTAGYIHAGTKNNIIPDDAEIGFTLRTYSQSVRTQMLASITRIVNAEAQVSGAVRAPLIDRNQSTPSVYNDPELTGRMRASLEAALGKDNVLTGDAVSASDDFAEFEAQGVPGFFLFLGGANPEQYAAAKKSGIALPSNHSPLFAPDLEPALRTGIAAELAMIRAALMH
jgi:amidohydrolase